jgi:hypothetical protein
MELNEDIALIKKLERYFRHHYNDTTIDWRDEFKYTSEDIKQQVCCTNAERRKILSFAYKIINMPAYNRLRLVDIFLVLIYTYYSLAYNEQSLVWLKLDTLVSLVNELDEDGNPFTVDGMISGNSSLAIQLYFDIATQDILETTPTGQQVNISRLIRTTMLDLAEGKKHKTMRRKRKARRSRKVRRSRRSRR